MTNQRILNDWECLQIACGWYKLDNAPPMDSLGKTILEVLDRKNPDDCSTYAQAMIKLKGIQSSSNNQEFETIVKTLNRAINLMIQIIEHGEITDPIAPRTEYAIAQGYTMHADDAKRHLKVSIRCLKNVLQRLENVIDEGRLDPMELQAVPDYAEAIVEQAMCCEWSEVVDYSQLIA